MYGLRLSSPSIPGPTPNPRRESWHRVVEWALFLTAVVIFAATAWGRIRTTGPATLAGLTFLAALARTLNRRTATRRLTVLLLAFVAAFLIRNHAASLIAHRVGRFTLLSGLGITAMLSVPSAVIAWLARLQANLRESPNDRRAVAIAVLAILLPTAFLYGNSTIHVWTGDTMPVVPTVVQMAQTGSRELSSFVPPSGLYRWDVCGPGRPYFVREVPGGPGVYSTYPAGMEVFAWPGVLAASALGLDIRDDKLHLRIEKLSASVLTGVSLAMFFLIAMHFGSLAGAFTVTWLLATGSVFSSTLGMLLWQQGGTVFWMLLALLVEFRTQGRPGWKGLLVQTLACGWILACRPSAVTFVVPFGLWVLARDWRRGLLLPLLSVLCYLPWGVMYWTLYRNPFGPAMGFLNETWFPGEFLLGVLASPGRGLFVFQPCLLLLALRLWPAARAGEMGVVRGWTPFALSMVALHLLLIASWPVWWGGFCYGSRLIAEVVPILALFLVAPVGWLLSRREGWIAIAVLGLLGFAIHVPCLYYDAWLWNALPISADANPWRLWDFAHPPFLYGLVPNP